MLNDKMMKLIAKKKEKGEKISDNEKQAKSSVLKDLHDSMSSHLMDKVKGLKKVSIMSDSEEGLKEGLDKAKDVVEGMPEEMQAPQEPESDEEESAEEESPEEMSEQELEAKIAELQKILEEKKQS